ncbi:MAG: hypothetical protein JST39_01590 [Bacteroidetes bacterium]|nr:hypothetical protein [Bacteroidota bacterium]
MELVLTRTYLAKGTNGLLHLDGALVSYTIELPWKNNQPQVSCIPEGRYALQKRYSPRLGVVLEVMDVPGRADILIHAANHALHELKGCIAPVSTVTGEGQGERSRAALSLLTEKVLEALRMFEPVFLTIQSERV